jgi:hypothetical protein
MPSDQRRSWKVFPQITDAPKNKGGRPPFKPTKAQRSDVVLLVACGTSEEAIAGVLGIDRGTLREHFAVELATGRAAFRLELRKKLKELADDGNVTALKYLDMIAAGEETSGCRQILARRRRHGLPPITLSRAPRWGTLRRLPRRSSTGR